MRTDPPDDDLVPDDLRAQVEVLLGKPMSDAGPSPAPDDVNLPMIRHWVDALDDRNPIYLDAEAGARTRHGGLVAPPAMLQTWTMARPTIAGLAERGGAAVAVSSDSALGLLTAAGYTGTLATNSELEFDRYLRLGERLQAEAALEEISPRKATGLGLGYFVTWVNTYATDGGEVVGRQRFRVFKFSPGTTDPDGPSKRSGSGGGKAAASDKASAGEELPAWELDVTPAVVVAGAIASRDFMPVHHDRDYAQAQGAPDIFMNILTTNGYVARYVTAWAGPEARLRGIAIRLGGPAIPGQPLRFSGRVVADSVDGDERVVEVALRAANDLGDHATGTVSLTLPASR